MDVLPPLLNNLLVLLQDAVNKPWKFRKGGGGEPEQPEKSCTGERQRRRVERRKKRGGVAWPLVPQLKANTILWFGVGKRE